MVSSRLLELLSFSYLLIGNYLLVKKDSFNNDLVNFNFGC